VHGPGGRSGNSFWRDGGGGRRVTVAGCQTAERLDGLANAMLEAHGKDQQQPARFYVDIRVDEHLAANDWMPLNS
jgi:hypothetical protein